MTKIILYHPNRCAVFLLLSSSATSGHATPAGHAIPEDVPQFLEVTGCGSPTETLDGVYRKDFDSEEDNYESLSEWNILSRVANGRWDISDGFSDLPLMKSNDLEGPWEKLDEEEETYNRASDLCRVVPVHRVAKNSRSCRVKNIFKQSIGSLGR